MYKVYAMTDDEGRITAINSDAFLTSPEGWTLIDQGSGDRYHHAQGNYLSGPLWDDNGVPRYKLADGKIAPRTAEEIEADAPADAVPTTEERLAALEQAGLERDMALMELAQLLTGGV